MNVPFVTLLCAESPCYSPQTSEFAPNSLESILFLVFSRAAAHREILA
jgi:hypothetical protein